MKLVAEEKVVFVRHAIPHYCFLLLCRYPSKRTKHLVLSKLQIANSDTFLLRLFVHVCASGQIMHRLKPEHNYNTRNRNILKHLGLLLLHFCIIIISFSFITINFMVMMMMMRTMATMMVMMERGTETKELHNSKGELN